MISNYVFIACASVEGVLLWKLNSRGHKETACRLFQMWCNFCCATGSFCIWWHNCHAASSTSAKNDF